MKGWQLLAKQHHGTHRHQHEAESHERIRVTHLHPFDGKHPADAGQARGAQTAQHGDIADSGTVDLKAQGVRPFIDAARVLALAHAIAPPNTAQRLRLSGAAYGAATEAEAMVEAFHFIQLLRLTRQFKALEDGGAPNTIELASLNELDRRILKEAFRQGRKLQTRLRLDYGL